MRRIKPVRWMLVLLIVLVLLPLASGVWASPNQRGLRQTVPTRTPVPVEPTDTPVPPTPEPPTATPKPKKEKPKQQQPTNTPVQVVDAGATATAVAIASAGYPESGGDYTLLGLVLLLLACGTIYVIVRGRRQLTKE
jgi:uncharacterized protein (DUF58 family)